MKKTTSSVLSPDQYADLITRLTDHITSECVAVDVESRFDDMVDELNQEHLCGPFRFLRPSAVMKEMMPTDYRCGVADMTGTDETLREIRGEYYDDHKVEMARDSFVAELQSELDDAESSLAAVSDLDNEDATECRAEVARLEEMIRAAEGHAF